MRQDMFLDDEHRLRFERDGYTVAPLLTPDDVERLLTVYREAPSGVSTGFYTTLWSDDLDYRRRVDEAIRDTVRHRLAGLLHPGRFFLNQFAVKRGNEPKTSECPLHQDWSYLDETEHSVVSIWCPLVDVDHVNGCLAVVPGSHLTTQIRPNMPRDQWYWVYRDAIADIRARHLIELPMRAGECILYDGRIIHGSQPNSSSEDRPVVVACQAPSSATLLHYWRSGPSSVDVFQVDESFFWKDVRWGSRPTDRPLVRTIEDVDFEAQISEEQYLNAWHQAGAMTE